MGSTPGAACTRRIGCRGSTTRSWPAPLDNAAQRYREVFTEAFVNYTMHRGALARGEHLQPTEAAAEEIGRWLDTTRPVGYRPAYGDAHAGTDADVSGMHPLPWRAPERLGLLLRRLPDQIPEEIILGGDHRGSWPGDNGLHFEPEDPDNVGEKTRNPYLTGEA